MNFPFHFQLFVHDYVTERYRTEMNINCTGREETRRVHNVRTILWYVTLCTWVQVFCSEFGVFRFVRNFGTFIIHKPASHRVL